MLSRAVIAGSLILFPGSKSGKEGLMVITYRNTAVVASKEVKECSGEIKDKVESKK